MFTMAGYNELVIIIKKKKVCGKEAGLLNGPSNKKVNKNHFHYSNRKISRRHITFMRLHLCI